MKKVLTWFNDTFKDTWLAKLVERAFFSLDNSSKGLSGKKLTAAAITYCVINMHNYYLSYAYIHKDFSLFPIILGSDFGFLLALFGINEYNKNRLSKTSGEPTTETPIADEQPK